MGGAGLLLGRPAAPVWWAIARGAHSVVDGRRIGHYGMPLTTQEAYAFREEPVTGPLFSLNPVPYPK